MNLKPFSLGSSTPKKENNPQQNDGIKRYIELNEEDLCFSLHIEDPKKASKITLSFSAFFRIQATKENTETHDKITGEATIEFHHKLESIIIFDKPATTEIIDLIILGFIAEALCYAEIPFETVIQDIDILSEFIRRAIHYYESFFEDITIDFSKMIPFLKVQKETPSSYLKQNLQKVALAGKSDKNGFLCKGILGITKNYIYIQTSSLYFYQMNYPDFISSEHRCEVIRALAWILLASLHFYGSEVFNINNPDIELYLSCSILDNAKFATPDKLRQILCDLLEQVSYF